jgi:hypothetical protein
MTDITTPPADPIAEVDEINERQAADRNARSLADQEADQAELTGEAAAALEADADAEASQDTPDPDDADGGAETGETDAQADERMADAQAGAETAQDGEPETGAQDDGPAGDAPEAPASGDARRATYKQHGNPEGRFWFFGTEVKTPATDGAYVATVEAGKKSITLLGADGQPVPHGSFGAATKFWAAVEAAGQPQDGDQPPADQPPADQPPADQPPADQPPADQPPAETPKATGKAPKSAEPQGPDSPLTKEQKWELAQLVINAAADKLYGARPPAGLKAMPENTARKQVAQWLKYLPTGGSWNEKLGDRPK